MWSNIMEKIERFTLPDSKNQNTLQSEILSHFKSKKQPGSLVEQVFYDTFDWRLYKNNLFLLREDNNYILCNLHNEQKIDSTIHNKDEQLKFWWDFPDSSIRQVLKPILEMRALLNLGKIKKRILPLQILNVDEKTVVRIRIEKANPVHPDKNVRFADQIIVEAVKGYQKPFKDICDFLSSIGLLKNILSNFQITLEAFGKKAGEYSSKLNLQLKHDMLAREAETIILKHLLHAIKQNDRGTKEDIDTEFLHDFRVAIRRTRSALTQIKDVFPGEIVNQYQTDFVKIGKSTNQLRDLDVYILNRKKYEEMLPMHLREGLKPLFSQLNRQRKINHRKIVTVLDSSFYKTVLISFETFLNSTDENGEDGTPNANIAIIDLSKKFISKRYRKVLKNGRKINNTTPDSYLHELRIECKKLRYLLEFFSSLFQEKKINLLIKYLKILQDNLGSFNDYSVQQKMLKKYLGTLKPGIKNSTLIAAAIGGLITELYHEQKAARKSFKKSFAEFSCDQSKNLFRELFG